MRKILLIVLASIITVGAYAQQEQEVDNSFGGWFFVDANHDFSNGIYLRGFFEHDNYQFQRLDCNYFRVSVGYKPLPWLSFGVNYVPVNLPGNVWNHYGEADVMGTLKSGNISVSLRERWRFGYNVRCNELRSRLKVSYKFGDSGYLVYLAPEVFTWGNEWMKTRHYVAAAKSFNEHIQLEIYYLYYAFKDAHPENVIGVGLNFEL